MLELRGNDTDHTCRFGESLHPYAWVEYIMANIGLVIVLTSYFQDFC